MKHIEMICSLEFKLTLKAIYSIINPSSNKDFFENRGRLIPINRIVNFLPLVLLLRFGWLYCPTKMSFNAKSRIAIWLKVRQ